MNNVEETAVKIFEYASDCVEFGMQPTLDIIMNYALALYNYGASDALCEKRDS